MENKEQRTKGLALVGLFFVLQRTAAPREQGEGAAAATQCGTMRGSLDACVYRLGVSGPTGGNDTCRLVLFSIG